MLTSDHAPGAPDGRLPAPGLALFTSCWGVATLFHLAWRQEWVSEPHRFVLAAAAFVAVLRPRWSWALLSLAVLQLYDVAWYLPRGSNHWVFTGFCNLALLGTWVHLALGRAGPVDRSAWWRSLSLVLRLNVTVLYFFVVFHKLNVDYFDPALSCGTKFWQEQRTVFRFMPDGPLWHWLAIIGTVAAEAAIPVLLWWRRTPLPGVLLLVLFHGVIGLNPWSGYYNFSSMLFACSLAFLGPEHVAALGAAWRRVAGVLRSGLADANWRRPAALLGGAVLASLALAWAERTYPGPTRMFRLWWMIYVACFLAGLAVCARVEATPARGWPGRSWVLLVPALLVLNGMCPHLGLKTETSFAMYSNLRTEGGRSNHLVWPAAWQPFDFQRQLVQVHDAGAKGIADNRWLWTEFELRRELADKPHISLELTMRGLHQHSVEHASDLPQLVEPLGVAGKLLRFRRVPTHGPEYCRH